MFNLPSFLVLQQSFNCMIDLISHRERLHTHTFWWDSTFLTNRTSEALLLVKYHEPTVVNENIFIRALKYIKCYDIFNFIAAFIVLVIIVVFIVAFIIIVILNMIVIIFFLTKYIGNSKKVACTCSAHFEFVIRNKTASLSQKRSVGSSLQSWQQFPISFWLAILYFVAKILQYCAICVESLCHKSYFQLLLKNASLEIWGCYS